MLSWRTLGLMALSGFVLIRWPLGENLTPIVLNMVIGAGLAALGGHVARVLEVGVWRILPAGRRTAIRALGLIVVALSVLFGGLFRWAAPEFFADVPIGLALPIFINLSVFALLLLLGMGRQLPRLFVVVYLLVVGLSFFFTSILFNDSPAFWVGGAALCAAIWIYASLTSSRAPTYSRRRFAWDLSFENFLVLADRGLSTGGSPVRKLLRSGRTGGANLCIATVVVAVIAAFQGFLFGRVPIPSPSLLLAETMIIAAISATILANQYARPARQLWLRWADSRAQLFRLVERMVVGDVCIVAGTGCAVALSVAASRGYDLSLVASFKLLVASFGLVITQVYIGLIFAAMHSRWIRSLVGLLAGIGVLFGTSLWLLAFGASGAAGAGFVMPKLITALLAMIALRYLAFASWRDIDWSHYRSAKK
jgi:hypothetical protein